MNLLFLELLAEFYPDKKEDLSILHKEGNELLSMTVKSINTAVINKNLKSPI
jgi:hypothetical protein